MTFKADLFVFILYMQYVPYNYAMWACCVLPTRLLGKIKKRRLVYLCFHFYSTFTVIIDNETLDCYVSTLGLSELFRGHQVYSQEEDDLIILWLRLFFFSTCSVLFARAETTFPTVSSVDVQISIGRSN